MNRIMPMVLLLLTFAGMFTTCADLPPGPGDEKPDTTSHNFTWTTYTFGGGSSSTLNDVFIINENDIWAVGEIYTKDSTGQSILFPYNVAHWDGQHWTLDQITTVGLRAVFGFGPNDIWAGSSAPYHWDGQKWTGTNVTGIFDGHINGFWGRSSNDLYMVGTNGSIAHFNGSGWQRISSGTTIDIQDIWGGVNARTGEQTILAVASTKLALPSAKKLLRIQGTSVSSVADEGLPFALSGVWFVAGRKYFIVGDGVYTNGNPGETWKADTSHPLIYKSAIRGNHQKDLFITGAFGLVSHFNGVGWKHFSGQDLPQFFGQYLRVGYKNNLVVAVGWKDDNAIILMGRRTQ